MAMVLMIGKLYCYQPEEELGQTIDQFWIEHETIWSWTASFATPYIWKSYAIKDGKSYLWHNLYSKPFTKVLGLVDCRVTSKILASYLMKEIGRTTSMYNVVRVHVYRVTHPRSRIYSMAQKICTKIPSREQDMSTTGPT